jgi:hypothetical protein
VTRQTRAGFRHGYVRQATGSNSVLVSREIEVAAGWLGLSFRAEKLCLLGLFLARAAQIWWGIHHNIELMKALSIWIQLHGWQQDVDSYGHIRLGIEWTTCRFKCRIVIMSAEYYLFINKAVIFFIMSFISLHGVVTLLEWSPLQATGGMFCLPWHRHSGTRDHGF